MSEKKAIKLVVVMVVTIFMNVCGTVVAVGGQREDSQLELFCMVFNQPKVY